MSRVAIAAITGLLRGYRFLISPCFGANCRFVPSCSVYAIQAIERHGPWCGARLAMKRILRCHPWGGCGFDPVPDDSTAAGSSAAAAPGPASRPGKSSPAGDKGACS